MTASCARGRAIASPLHWLAAVLLLIALVAPAAAAEPIDVALDQAKVMQLPDRATSVVVGNPLIADLSIQSSGLAVITGRGYGATNVIALDRNGVVLLEKTVAVKGPSDPTVVVYRGPTRQTYSCTPDCSPRITLGDTAEEDFDKETNLYKAFFDKTLKQTLDRNKQATEAGVPASAH
jgi:Pilus formation protein N terminal region